MFGNNSRVIGGPKSIRFVAPIGQENGVANKYQCISLMREHLAKSFEEIRLEDYQLNRRDSQHASRSASLQPNFFSGEITRPFCQFGPAAKPMSSGFGANLRQINGGGAICRSGTVAPASVGFNLSSANQPQPLQSMFCSNGDAVIPAFPFGGVATSMTNAPVLIASGNFTIQPRLGGPFNFSFSCNANSATPSSPSLTNFGGISFGFPANPSATGNGTTTGLEAGFTAAAPTFLSSNRSNHQFGNPCSSIFGQPAQPLSAATTNGIFPFPSFHATTVVGTPTLFVAKTGLDFLTKRNNYTSVNVHYQSISIMNEYEAKSYEELRFEDYQLNRKGPQRALFGSASAQLSSRGTIGAFGQFGQTATPSLNFVGGFDSNSRSTNGLFSVVPKQKTTSVFGIGTAGNRFGGRVQQQPSAFGAFGSASASTQSVFGQSAGGGGVFGGASSATASSGAFSSPNTAGSSIPFVAPEIQEIVPRSNGTMTTIDSRLQSISTMKQYKDKSYEELRFEDYRCNRRQGWWTNIYSMDIASGATSVLGGFTWPTTSAASMQANSPAELRKVGAKMTLYLRIKFKMEMEAYLFRGRSVIELPGFPGYRLRPIDMNSFRVLFIKELQSDKKEKTALCVIGGCTKDPIEDTWLCREHNKRMEPPGAGAQEPRPFFRRVQQVPPFNPPNDAGNLRNDEFDLSFLFSNEP